MLIVFNKATFVPLAILFLLVTILDATLLGSEAYAETSSSKLLRRENAELKKELDIATRELNALKQTHKALLRKRVGEINPFLAEENSTYRSKVAELEGQNNRLKYSLSHEKSEKEEALTRVEHLSKYRQGYEVLKKRIAESNLSCAPLTDLDANRKAKIIEQENQRKLADVQGQLDRLRALYSKKEEEYQFLEQLHEQLAKSNETNKIRISDLERELNKSKKGKSKQDNIKTSRHVRIPKEEFEELKASSNKMAVLQEANDELTKKLSLAKEIFQEKKSDYEGVISEVEKQKGQILSYEEKVETQKNIIEALEFQLAQVNKSHELIKQLKAQIADLQQRYTEANNLVMLKDTEIRMMKSHSPKSYQQIQRRSIASRNIRTSPGRGKTRNHSGTLSYRSPQTLRPTPSPTPLPTPVSVSAMKEPMSVRVIGEKVNLRVRPGKKHSPIQQVAKGTELIVESEVGEWFQIITPTGQRAYVHSTVVEVINPSGGPKPLSQSLSLPALKASQKNSRQKHVTSNSQKNTEEAQAIQLLKDAMRQRK